MKDPRFHDGDVKAAFDGYPRPLRAPLLRLRRLIFATAAETDGVGCLVETLKWGQPAYLTENPKSGSTIRLGTLKHQMDGKDKPDGYALFFHCQTTLVSDFRAIYPDALTYAGNRAVLFSRGADIPLDAVRHCIGLALTYHARRRA